MKTSARIAKYEPQVVKPNPGNTVDLYSQLNDMPLDETLSNNASNSQNQECFVNIMSTFAIGIFEIFCTCKKYTNQAGTKCIHNRFVHGSCMQFL